MADVPVPMLLSEDPMLDLCSSFKLPFGEIFMDSPSPNNDFYDVYVFVA